MISAEFLSISSSQLSALTCKHKQFDSNPVGPANSVRNQHNFIVSTQPPAYQGILNGASRLATEI